MTKSLDLLYLKAPNKNSYISLVHVCVLGPVFERAENTVKKKKCLKSLYLEAHYDMLLFGNAIK